MEFNLPTRPAPSNLMKEKYLAHAPAAVALRCGWLVSVCVCSREAEAREGGGQLREDKGDRPTSAFSLDQYYRHETFLK